jgi:hypothetical protein
MRNYIVIAYLDSLEFDVIFLVVAPNVSYKYLAGIGLRSPVGVVTHS